MLSHTPEGRGSQPGQRGAGRDHPRSDKRVQAPGGGTAKRAVAHGVASHACAGAGAGIF